jgi:anoctamin-4
MGENYIEVEAKSFGEILSENGNFSDYEDFKSIKTTQMYEELVRTSNNLKFRDGERKIDMVLCYEESDDENEGWEKRDKRRSFHEQLRKEGLDLEFEHKSDSLDQKTYFIKIHIPSSVEQRYAKAFNVKPPIQCLIGHKEEPQLAATMVKSYLNAFLNALIGLWESFQSLFDPKYVGKSPSYYTEIKGRSAKEVFVEKVRADCITCAQRSMLVHQILLRTKFDDSGNVGIQRLINDNVYAAYFPLHEEISKDAEPYNDRTVIHWMAYL